MFSKEKRLQREDFPTVSSGRRRSSANFSVSASAQAQGYSVVIPKKVMVLSVDRHSLKRRVIGVLKDIPLPASLVVYPKQSAKGLTHQEMKKELEELILSISR
jgi:ribonuclease P protein component